MAIKETVPFNFDEIYSAVEAKFREKGYDVQEGSNTMQLVTAMSYLTSMLNVNTAVNINETLLPQATKRSMILQDARVLGYEIEHIQSYKYEIALNFTEVGEISIPRYSSFTAGAYQYHYLGSDIVNQFVESTDVDTTKYYSPDISREEAIRLGGSWDNFLDWASFPDATFSQVVTESGYDFKQYNGRIVKINVVEGILHKYEDNANLTKIIGTDDIKDYFDIPFINVEENGIDLFLSYLEPNGTFHENEQWRKADSFLLDTDSVLNREFVRLDNIEFGTPRIHFKIGNVGRSLYTNTVINVNVLESNGSLGKIEDTALLVPDTLFCEIQSVKLLTQGAEEETDDSIKANAPLFNNTANRIITKSDYESFCNRQAAVKTSVIWDGNDEYPKRPGHIWFSFLPSNNERELIVDPSDVNNNTYTMFEIDDNVNWYIESSEISNVFSQLDKFKIPTLIFHHRHPVYLDFEYNIEVVKYLASVARKVQHQNIFEIIDEYFKEMGGVENFDFEYLNSNLVRRIDSQITDSTGLNISLNTSVSINNLNIIAEVFDNDVTSADPSETSSTIYEEFTKLIPNAEIDRIGFGFSLALGDDVLVVGSMQDTKLFGLNDDGTRGGEVRIYDWIDNEYVLRMTIQPYDLRPNDGFSRVAIFGNRLIVGSPLYDQSENGSQGKVYVYDILGTSSTLIQEITLPSTLWFGASVALDNGSERLIISEPVSIVDDSLAGKVHVFEWNGTQYDKIQEFSSASFQINEVFGSSVAADNGTLVVGSHGNSENGTNSGKVYVYQWTGTEYVIISSISASDAQPGDWFGSSVEIYSDKIIVGAILEDSAGTNAGKVYFYELQDGVWTEKKTMVASDPESNGNYGSDISIRGDRLVISGVSNLLDPYLPAEDGKVYVYNVIDVSNGDSQTNQYEVEQGSQYKQVRVHLGVPYESFIENDGITLKIDKLPSINTDNFTGDGRALFVDYDSEEVVRTSQENSIVIYDIKLGESIIGKYRVYLNDDPYIEIILYVIGVGYSQGLSISQLNAGVTMNVAYVSPNIKMSRNTIPRLKAVNFV
jgi:hypothetical protein